jgi:hypothetical protein
LSNTIKDRSTPATALEIEDLEELDLSQDNVVGQRLHEPLV